MPLCGHFFIMHIMLILPIMFLALIGMAPSLETVVELRLRRFWGLFWPILHSFLGGNIRKLILPPKKECKIGSKEPQNRQKLNFNDSLLEIVS